MPTTNVFDSAQRALAESVTARVWIISDLQQSDPQRAERCLMTAIDDFRALGLSCQQIWYLGDSVEGHDLARLHATADMQHAMLAALDVPVRFVLGNHDFDYTRKHSPTSAPAVPFYERVRQTISWRTISHVEEFYFLDELAGHQIVFFSDHADPSGRWVSTHGQVHGEAALYAHDRERYRSLSEQIAASGKPCIIAAHYAFAGGNRPSALMDQMLPLPANVRLHVYGHAHIGDSQWAGKDCFRKIACIDGQPIPQVDIASLENYRGSGTRSAFLEFYNDGSLGVLFRNHDLRQWTDIFLTGRDSHHSFAQG